MERLLGVVHDLSEKVESNEGAAGDLLRQCESLQEELKSMRQVSWRGWRGPPSVNGCLLPRRSSQSVWGQYKVKYIHSRWGVEFQTLS